jgi:phosphoglycolate phosphatase-like HAD superfamily hydrolase
MIYGFDLDGTLVESFTDRSLPGARERLAALPWDAKTFIATNQAGPVYRAVLDDPKYPTVETVVQNIRQGLAVLRWRPDRLLLCCCSGKHGAASWRAEAAVAAQFDDQLAIALPGITVRVFLQAHYRKPQLGMLNAARGEGLEYSADTMIYVGDMASDAQSAKAAGAQFVDAAAWLGGVALA